MANTGPTTGFSAGQDTNLSSVDYALEPIFGQAPKGLYTPLRFTSCTLAPQDSESAPDEINAIPEVAESVLNSRATSGSIGSVLSVGTFEDMLAGVMGADWSNITITASSKNTTPSCIQIRTDGWSGYDGVIAFLTPGGAQIPNSLAALPSAGIVTVTDSKSGAVIKAPYALNSVKSVLIVDHNILNASASLSSSVLVCGDNSTIAFNGITNGALAKSFTFRKNLLSQWELYTGTIINQVQIQLQQGQPATIDMDLIGSNMSLSKNDISSSVAPRTTSPLINTVDGFQGCSIFNEAPAGCMRSATLTLSRDGSGQDFGMGHTGACGMRMGSFKAALELEYFFKSYDQFTAWASGKTGPISVSVIGADGKGYMFTALNAVIRNPKSPISGKNQTVVANISATCNPLPGVGGTFNISRIGR